MIRRLTFALSLFVLGCTSSSKNQEHEPSSVSPDSIRTKDSVRDDETEEEESERLLRERAIEDEKAFAELNVYDGKYSLSTESEGAEGSLQLTYEGNKSFSFKLDLTVVDICKGSIDGKIFMDRTQHGLFQQDSCLLHFNFMGSWGDSGFIVEIEQPDPCNLMNGDCIFTGKYLTGTSD